MDLAVCSVISLSKPDCRCDILGCVHISSEFDHQTQSHPQHLQASLSYLTGFFGNCEVAAVWSSLSGFPSSPEVPGPEAQQAGCSSTFAMPMPLAALWALDPEEPGMLAPLSKVVLKLVPSVPS